VAAAGGGATAVVSPPVTLPVTTVPSNTPTLPSNTLPLVAPVVTLLNVYPKTGDTNIAKDVRPTISLAAPLGTVSDGTQLALSCKAGRVAFTATSALSPDFKIVTVTLVPKKASITIGDSCTVVGNIITTGTGGTTTTVVSTSFTIYAAPVATSLVLLAGTADSPGSKDGARLAATFHAPGRMTRDAQGNVYVADGCTGYYDSHALVRKISPSGEVTTVAGSNTKGPSFRDNYQDKRCWALTTHPDGNLYATDLFNYTIERISLSGLVTTIAGRRGEKGNTNGNGTSARFSGSHGIAADAQGNLFVSDTIDHTIRKIDPSGNVTTYAGQAGIVGSADGALLSARFEFPTAMKFDSNGKLFIADKVGIRVVANGTVTTVITFADLMRDICGVANVTVSDIDIFSDGRLAVAINNCSAVGIYKNNQLQTLLGLKGGGSERNDFDGTASTSRFFFPTGVAFTPNGELLITDIAFHNIKSYSAVNDQVALYAGKRYELIPIDGVLGIGRLSNPGCLHLASSGNVWFSQFKSGTGVVLRNLDVAGNLITLPQLILGVDGANCVIKTNTDGSFIAADLYSKNLRLFSATGQFIQLLTSSFQQRINGQQTAVSANGDIYFGDANGFVSKYSNGVMSVVSTTKIGAGAADAIAISSNGIIYASDGCSIYQLSPAGVPTLLNPLSSNYPCDYEDGPIASAKFTFINGLAVGNSGEVYVSDSGNSVIRRIYKGQVDIVAGTLWLDETSVGTGAGAIHGQRGIAFDASNNSLIILGTNSILRAQLPALPN
jgi:sugar lactone lactonase YvrE